MAIFGVRLSAFGDSDEHYASNDDVLFEWLLANNYSTSKLENHYLVPIPEGYKLFQGNIVPDTWLTPEQRNDAVSDFVNVTVGSPENDKALLLLNVAMVPMESDAFEALNIDEERILDYMIY